MMVGTFVCRFLLALPTGIFPGLVSMACPNSNLLNIAKNRLVVGYRYSLVFRGLAETPQDDKPLTPLLRMPCAVPHFSRG